jgi:serine/threonine protein kinase
MLYAETEDDVPHTPLATPLAPALHNVATTPQKKGAAASSGVRFPSGSTCLSPTSSPSQTLRHAVNHVASYERESRFSRMLLEHKETSRIGAGSFGEVLNAVYELDLQSYAIKVSSKEIGGASDLQHRLQEVYAASVCSHPNLVKYYDSWVDDSRLHIRLEFADGGNISKIPTPWDEESLAWLLLQIGLALQWLHSSGIAHLDIKPDNILVVHSSDLNRCMFKLGDLGLARKVRTNTDHLPSLSPSLALDDDFGEGTRTINVGENDDEGDYRYLCPTILANNGHSQAWNKEADMFSLGATVVQLMGGDPNRARYREHGPHIHDRSLYSETLARLVQQLCDLTPAQRPSAIQIVETSLVLLSHTRPDVIVDVERRCRSRRRMLDELHEKMRDLEKEISAAESSGRSTSR